MLAGYEEPSLVFALGADTVLSDGRGAAELGANAGGLALVQDDERPAFLARLAELEANAAAVDDCRVSIIRAASRFTSRSIASRRRMPRPRRWRTDRRLRVCAGARAALDISMKVGNIAKVVVFAMDRQGGAAGQSFTGSGRSQRACETQMAFESARGRAVRPLARPLRRNLRWSIVVQGD